MRVTIFCDGGCETFAFLIERFYKESGGISNVLPCNAKKRMIRTMYIVNVGSEIIGIERYNSRILFCSVVDKFYIEFERIENVKE